MRSVFSAARRAAAVLAVIALLLVPVAALADDPQINPPQPQSSPTFWHMVLVLVTHGRVLPFIS